MFDTLSGMVMDSRLEHPQKAPFPISITLSGISMDFRQLQSLKALHSIFATLSGMMTLVKPVHLQKV